MRSPAPSLRWDIITRSYLRKVRLVPRTAIPRAAVRVVMMKRRRRYPPWGIHTAEKRIARRVHRADIRSIPASAAMTAIIRTIPLRSDTVIVIRRQKRRRVRRAVRRRGSAADVPLRQHDRSQRSGMISRSTRQRRRRVRKQAGTHTRRVPAASIRHTRRSRREDIRRAQRRPVPCRRRAAFAERNFRQRSGMMSGYWPLFLQRVRRQVFRRECNAAAAGKCLFLKQFCLHSGICYLLPRTVV